MANTVITNYGAQYVLSAGDPGPYICIKYFLPCYDFRLDTNIHTAQSYSTSAISYTSTISATSAIVGAPTGEKIWNESGYNLSTNYIVSGTGEIVTSTTVSAYKQSSMGIGVNTMGGVPLSPSHYGTSFDPPSSASNKWTITGKVETVGYNAQTSGDRAKYWKVTDYYPVADDSGNLRGAFKCHLDKAVGRFKFNKIAMYAVRVDSVGVETADDPVFFAESFVKETCVKSDILQEGFDDFVVDVQLDLTPLNNYWVSGFFSTSGDYWSRTVGGLYYSDSVGIGSFSGGTDRPNASLHVRPVNDTSKHLIRLDARDTGVTTYIDVVSGGENYPGSYLSATGKGLLIDELGKADDYINKIYTNHITLESTSTVSKFQQLTADSNGNVSLSASPATGGLLTIYDNVLVKSVSPVTTCTYDLGITPEYVWHNSYTNHVSASDVTTLNVDTQVLTVDDVASIMQANVSTCYVTSELYIKGTDTIDYKVGRYVDISSDITVTDLLGTTDATSAVNHAYYTRVGDIITLDIVFLIKSIVGDLDGCSLNLPTACEAKLRYYDTYKGNIFHINNTRPSALINAFVVYGQFISASKLDIFTHLTDNFTVDVSGDTMFSINISYEAA